jgi:ATP-dependent RNA helicase RhlE
MSFEHLGLKPELLRAVAEKGYTTPSPIQAQAIPAVLSGRDLIAGAQTGTGKTAAFVLPILQRLTQSSHTGRAPRALVLTPTRELAAQVAESARDYGKYASVRTAVVFGGVSINPQIDAMRSGCDLLIATPGRLLDLAEQRAVDLRNIQVFVLDEADRMLDMGFIHAIRRVLKLLPAQRQNLMFSATYSEEIRELTTRFLRDPATVEVAPRNATADRVEQSVYRVSKEHKRHLLAHLIDSGNWHQVLVFTRTKHGANRLAQQLEGSGIRSAAIHGNKSQGARVRALADFKDNRITALVATEVAARGLDIKELPHVVNYELPNVPEDYVHRIGRTARAGTTGSAVSLVSPDEAPLLRDIERLLRRSLSIAPLPEFPITAPPPGADGSDRQPRDGGERRHSHSGGRHSGNRDQRGDRNGKRPQGNNRDGGGRDSQRRPHGNEQGSSAHGSRRSDDRGANRDQTSRPSEPNGNVAPRVQRDDQRPGQRHSHDHRGGHGTDQRGGNRAHGHGRPGGFSNGNGHSRPQRQRRTGSY